MPRRLGLPLPLLLAAASLTCGGDDLLLPSEAEPAAIAVVKGADQIGTVGRFLPESVTVRVTDSRGRPVVDQAVAFHLASPDQGIAIPDTALTNTDGRASTRWRLGLALGPYRLTAMVVGYEEAITVPASVSAVAMSDMADSLLAVRGGGQTGPVNSVLPESLVVRVNDRYGNPVEGVELFFATQGGGSVSAASRNTGADGQASVTRTLGPGAGPQGTVVVGEGLKGSPLTIGHTATPSAAAELRRDAGNNQTGPAALPLPDSLVVRLVDQNGNGVAGVPVGWVVATGGGSVSPTSSTTGADGRAATQWVLGPAAGPNSLIASAAGFSVGFTAAGTPDVPTSLAINGGNGQSAVAGTAVAVPPSVIVRDANGNPVAGVGVTFAVTGGGGEVTPTASIATNAAGIAAVTGWTLGTVAGPNSLRATASGPAGPLSGSPATFTATGTVGPPAKLGLTTQPSPSAQSGVPLAIQPVVQRQDANGNAVSGAGVVVTASLASAPAGGTLGGTTTATTNAAGAAAFTNLALSGPSGTYTLRFSATGLTDAVSNAVTLGVGAAVKLGFTVQPSTVVAGSAISPAVQVAIQDAGGNTVTSATGAVTVALGANPGGGTLSGTRTVSAVNGVATFSTLSINRAGAGYTLTASASGLTGATSAAFTVTPGPANRLAFTVQPSNTTAGATITPAVEVTVQDALGNTVTSSTASVTLAIGTNPGGGTLAGTRTVSAASGVASFSTLSIDRAGNGYTLTASASGLSGATSSAFNVTAGGGARLAFTQQPTNAQAGANISPAIRVEIQDASGNRVPGATTAVTLVIKNNPGGGSLSGQTTVSAVDGVATFGSVRIDRVGNGYTLEAFASGLVSATSAGFNISPGPASQLAFTVQPTTTEAKQAISPPVQVTVQDAFGNRVTNATTSVTVGIGSNPGNGTLSGTRTRNASAGIASFDDLSINKKGTGYTLTASASGLASATSAGFDIVTGSASSLELVTQPSASVQNGAVFPQQPVVQVVDAGGNPVSQGGIAVTAAIASGGGTLNGTRTVNTNGNGVASFSNLSITGTVGDRTLGFSASGLIGVGSNTVTVTAGAATRLAFTVQPSSAAAGQALSPAVQVSIQDASGNTVTGATNQITVAIGSNPGGGTLSGTKTVGATAGVATFSGLSIDKVGTGYTLTASAGGLTGATSSAFNITPGAASQLAFTVQPTNTSAGATIAPAVQVTVQDASGNTVTGATTQITVAIGANPGGGTLGGTKVVNASNGVASFSTLSIDKAGTGYTLTASASGLTGATSSAFNVTAGAATKLAVTVQPSNTKVSTAISPAVQVTVQDANGNTVTGATNAITVAIGTNPGGGVLNGTKTVNASGGIATFSGLSIDKTGNGYTLTASATGLTGATSAAFNITP